MRRWWTRTVVGFASVVVMAAPAAGTLLAPTSPTHVPPPVGTVAWDARHLPDPVRTDPGAVHRFLAGRSDGADLAARYPGVVGDLDGAPVSLRYQANRDAMRAAGGRYARWPGNFLLFDPRGNGRVAQVFGDLTTADRIAVLVPGVDSRAENFVRGLGDKTYRAPATQAANLYRAAHHDRLAVIAWLGYDTPRGVGRDAAREDLAAAGSVALHRFLAGLTVVRPDATIALFGHSYGSTVIGLAAHALPRQVTDIAVFGSPGMGVNRAADLHTAATVWAGQSTSDWIRWVPGVRLFGLGHGTKPTDPSFGAHVFPTAKVPDHDHYLAPGTDSLAFLARVAAGTQVRS
ncbi:MAG TPA: alpha/beta hydrolase [Actinocatenispora sp.]